MDYQKHYNTLINTRKQLNRVRVSRKNPNFIYYEKHHIVPKSLGGEDNKENLILLTAKEHLIAHLLLVKCYDVLRRQLYNNKNETFKSLK